MKEIAYQLLQSVSRLGSMPSGDAYDLRAFEFLKGAELWHTYADRPLELPETVFFICIQILNLLKNLICYTQMLIILLFRNV